MCTVPVFESNLSWSWRYKIMMTYCWEIIPAPIELKLSVGFLGVGEFIIGCVFTIFGITPPPKASSLQKPFFWRTVHTFTLVSTSLQRPLFFCPQGGCCREVQLCIKLLVIANVHNTKKLPLSFQVNIYGILIGVTPLQVFFWLIAQ